MLIAKYPEIVFLRFTPILLPRGKGMCTPFLTLQQIMNNFFIPTVEIFNKFGLSELNHCCNRKAPCTFQHNIKAL